MIALRPEITTYLDDDVSCFINEEVSTESDKKEFVSNDRYEKEVASLDENELVFNDVVFKSNFIQTFKHFMPLLDLSDGMSVLEMGAAHGWASVILKKKFESCYIVASDLVPDTVKHTRHYERVLDASVDEKWAFNCRDIPFASSQFDRVFTFAAFHHFGEYADYTKALTEMIRILKPGGKIVLLYEPSSPKMLYPFAFKRVNKKREVDGVDEDVLVVDDLRKVVRDLGCSFYADPSPFYRFRDGIAATNYYFLLSKLGRLKKMFVSTVNIVIQKPA